LQPELTAQFAQNGLKTYQKGYTQHAFLFFLVFFFWRDWGASPHLVYWLTWSLANFPRLPPPHWPETSINPLAEITDLRPQAWLFFSLLNYFKET
jgi:hypothetical protein